MTPPNRQKSKIGGLFFFFFFFFFFCKMCAYYPMSHSSASLVSIMSKIPHSQKGGKNLELKGLNMSTSFALAKPRFYYVGTRKI